MTPSDLLTWQLAHYTQRLTEAKTAEEKRFLRETLHRLKQPNQYDTDQFTFNPAVQPAVGTTDVGGGVVLQQQKRLPGT